MNATEIRAILSLGGIFALRLFGLFMIVPVFSVEGYAYSGATPALIGLAVGVYGLTQACLQIPFSMLADRFNRKAVLIAGLLIFAAGGVIAAMAETIYGAIIGRALAGAGAVSAIIMALVADYTREQVRSRSMAFMGFIIAGSIILAFALGPLLVNWLGMRGLFWLTAVFGVLGIGLVLLTPKAQRLTPYYVDPPLKSLRRLIVQTRFYPLYVTVLVLHLLMTALFVWLPPLLTANGIGVAKHGLIYLPLLMLGFVLAVPLIIVAEKQRRMKRIMRVGSFLLLAAFGVSLLSQNLNVLLVALGIFFIGFNLLEATIPSWLTKAAGASEKTTVLGLSATAQFGGAFLGGVLGGVLIPLSSFNALAVLTLIALVGALTALKFREPPYLFTWIAALPEGAGSADGLLNLSGVSEVLLLTDSGQAFVKIDRQAIDEEARQELSRYFARPVDF